MLRCLVFLLCFLGIALAEPRLVWKNGSSISAALTGGTEERLTWENPIFQSPVSVSLDVLHEISSEIPPNIPGSTHEITFLDGGRIFGDVLEQSLEFVTLVAKHSGTVQISKDSIQSIRRIRGDGVLWSGPFGKVGWKDESLLPVADSNRWIQGTSASGLQFAALSKMAWIELNLPERFEMEVTFQCGVRPEFKLVLLHHEIPISLETWGEKLALRQESQFQQVMKLEDEQRELTLRFFWDWRENRGFVCSKGGDQLAEWTGAPNPDFTAAKTRLELTSQSPQLELLSLQFNSWEGLEPTKISRASAVTFSQKPDRSTNAESTWFNVQLKDTSRFFGEFIKADRNEITLKTNFSDRNIQLKTSGIRKLGFSQKPVNQRLTKLDQLMVDGQLAHGTWTPGAGSTLNWQMVGAESPVEITQNPNWPVRIKRALSNSVRFSTGSLFHFKSREIVPGRLLGMSETTESVRIQSPRLEKETFSQTYLQAAILDPSPTHGSGFSTPGWQAKGERELPKLSDGVLKIPPKSSWSHPSILLNGKMSLTLLGKRAHDSITLRMRLFAEGTNPKSKHTSLVFATRNQTIYVSQVKNGQQITNLGTVPFVAQNPISIDLSWSDALLNLLIQGKEFRIEKSDSNPRSGVGLILESKSLWGRDVSDTVSIINFRIPENPETTWIPLLNAKAKERALFVPRFRRNSAPRHLLIGPNLDVVRGTIEKIDSSQILIRSKLDPISVPKERTTAIVWLEAPNSESVPRETAKRPAHWVTLRNGTRFRLAVENFGPKLVTGESEILGSCQLPTEQVYSIQTTEPAPDLATETLASFRLQPAPEPKIPSNEPYASSNQLVGQPAPDFELPTAASSPFKLSDQLGKVVILDFWASWCAPCVRKLPELMALVAKFPDEQIQLIAVNQGEPPALVKAFANAQKWDHLDIAFDTNQKIGKTYGIEVLPTTVLIDTEGKIIQISEGGSVTVEQIQNLLR